MAQAAAEAEAKRRATERQEALASFRNEALPLLRAVYGFDEFREHQLEAVFAFVSRRDVFLELGTGGGKSLVYELSALVLTMRAGAPPPVVFVLGPLRDVLSQGVARLRSRLARVPANSPFKGLAQRFRVGLWSSTSEWDLDTVDCVPDACDRDVLVDDKDDVSTGVYNLILTTPEKVLQHKSLLSRGISSDQFRPWVCIDECDVCLEWSSFRPSYRFLFPKLWFQGAPVLCLTATATTGVRHLLGARFRLVDPEHLRGQLDRGLFYEVRPVRPKDTLFQTFGEMIIEELSSGGKTIVYVHTPREAVSAAKEFKKNLLPFTHNIQASHAILDANMRRAIVKDFDKDGNLKLLFTTAVLARGLDIPDISTVLVVHSDSLSSLLQGFGRAARSAVPQGHPGFRQARCLFAFSIDKLTKPVCEMNAAWDVEKSWHCEEESIAMQRFCLAETCLRRVMSQHYEFELKAPAAPANPAELHRCCSVCDKYGSATQERILLTAAGEALPVGFTDLTAHALYALEVFGLPAISCNDAGFIFRVPKRNQAGPKATRTYWMALVFFLEQNGLLTRPAFPKGGSDIAGGVVAGSRRLTVKGEGFRTQLRNGYRCVGLFTPATRPSSANRSSERSLKQHLGDAVFRCGVDALYRVVREHNIDVLRAPYLLPYASLRGIISTEHVASSQNHPSAVADEEAKMENIASEFFSDQIVEQARQAALDAARQERLRQQQEKRQRRTAPQDGSQ